MTGLLSNVFDDYGFTFNFDDAQGIVRNKNGGPKRETRLHFLLSRVMHILPYTTMEAAQAAFIQQRERTKNSLKSQVCQSFIDLARNQRVFQKPL